MITADLITGFLGAGKTSFIAEYAAFIASEGKKTAVIVNDLGAINIDRLLLEEKIGDICHVEMVIGGDVDCTRRRLKTKLIALAMDKYERVIVEPSGIFEAEEFLDLIYDEPLDGWYRVGSIINIADYSLMNGLSEKARYVFASQLAISGSIIISKALEDEKHAEEFAAYMNGCLEEFECKRRIEDYIIWRKEGIGAEQLRRISEAGYRSFSIKKLPYIEDGSFSSDFFFELPFYIDGRPADESYDREKLKEELARRAQSVFDDERTGRVYRIKGYLKSRDEWIELNAVKGSSGIRVSDIGQDVFIIIGEDVDKTLIGEILSYGRP